MKIPLDKVWPLFGKLSVEGNKKSIKGEDMARKGKKEGKKSCQKLLKKGKY